MGQLDSWRELKIREFIMQTLEEELVKLVLLPESSELPAQFSSTNSIQDKFGSTMKSYGMTIPRHNQRQMSTSLNINSSSTGVVHNSSSSSSSLGEDGKQDHGENSGSRDDEIDDSEDKELSESNQFAAELLHLIRTSQNLFVTSN